MNDASFVGNDQGQPSCFLDLKSAQVLWIEKGTDAMVFFYYWSEWINDTFIYYHN